MLSGRLALFMTTLIDSEISAPRKHHNHSNNHHQNRQRQHHATQHRISSVRPSDTSSTIPDCCRYSIIQNGRRSSTVIYQFLLICIILQDVDLTETNTRTKTFLELQNFPLSSPKSQPPSSSLVAAGAAAGVGTTSELYQDVVPTPTRVRRNYQAEREEGPPSLSVDAAGPKLKTSATRIRFSSAKRSARLDRFMRGPEQQQQQTVSDRYRVSGSDEVYAGERTLQQPLSAHRSREWPSRRKMAPAYEYFWPSGALNQQDEQQQQDMNQVMIDRQKIGRHYTTSSNEDPEGRGVERENLDEGNHQSSQNRTRNLIPRPMKGSATSETIHKRVTSPTTNLDRSFKTRDLRRGKIRRTSFKRKSKREKSGDDYYVAEDEPDDMATMGAQSGAKKDDRERIDGQTGGVAAATVDDEAESLDDTPSEDEQISINLKLVDDNNAEERSDSRPKRANYSPVYPPGDLDILYSDALLVYVKDFNHFIKR